MTDVWESAWESLNSVLADVAVELRSRNSALWWTCGHRENEAFPFDAYASFNASGVAGDEDVVISIGFKRMSGEIAFSTDISRGTGEILADGPQSRIQLATDTGSLRSWIERCVERACSFIVAERELLARELAGLERGGIARDQRSN